MSDTATSANSTPGATSSRRDWLVLGSAAIGKAGLYLLAGFVLWSLVPVIFGMTVTTVASGSMEPRIMTGDVVAAAQIAATDLREEQVILFEDPAVPDRLKIHRIIDLSEAGIQTKGDANSTPDSMLASPESVVGVGFIRVPYIGVPINWFHQGELLKLGAFLATLAILAFMSNLDSDLRRRDREARAAKHAAAKTGFAARNPKLVQVGAPVAALILVAVTVAYVVGGTAANAAFASQTSSAASFQAAASFAKPWDQASFHFGYAETGVDIGAAIDDAGTPENGVLAGGITRASENGNPFVTFDGSTGKIYTERYAGAAPNVFTLETWFRTTTTAGGRIIGYGNTQTGASNVTDRQLYMNNAGRISFNLYANGAHQLITTPAAYNDGKWHLVTATVSSAGSVVYIDGARVVADATMTKGQGTAADGYWRIGYDRVSAALPDAPSSNYFGGSMDNTSLYLVALSPAEVAANYSYGR
jgi:signal peptidase I